MIIQKAQKNNNSWELVSRIGEKIILPISKDVNEIEIGLLGTRTVNDKIKSKTNAFINLINSLGKPVYLVDTRRNGVGGSSSWSPREFETVIADKILEQYNYIHIPSLCPSINLFDNMQKANKKEIFLTEKEINQELENLKEGNKLNEISYKHWQIYKEVYKKEILSNDEIIKIARAIVEYSASIGGLAIFLCSEEHRHNFNEMSQEEQDDAYCHRFTLFSLVKKSIEENSSIRVTKRVLSLDDMR